ncbi:hypothetical protein [Kitasatospora sp. NPDC088134]|uniref:hypothetical protein n=1 Tax=Kitasatospora sp. NPDC088134 TaxID=3364071 RepID=UPI0038001885
MVGISISGAPSASATSFVCNYWGGANGAKCQHQSSFHTGLETGPTTWWTEDEKLSYQDDGNLVIYCLNRGTNAYGKWINNGQAVWASGVVSPNTFFNPTSHKLNFWSDGNLATYYANSGTAFQYRPEWDAHAWAGSDSWAVLQADGNFVIWQGGRAVWATNTYHVCPGTEDYWNGYQ